MPNGSVWQTKFVKCPYYIKHDKFRIVCEGINQESTTHIVFGSTHKLDKYMHSRCNDISGCRKCPLHDTLDRKYGDAD